MPGSKPKRTWIRLTRATRATTRAHTREIQRTLPSARSSCNSQADTPANKSPTAETGFIATGPGRTPLKSPTANVQPTRTMQPTSMVTMLEDRENVFREVTSPGMESPPSPGRPAASFPCPAISYTRYRLFPATNRVAGKSSSKPRSTTTGCYCTLVSGYSCRATGNRCQASVHSCESRNPLRQALHASNHIRSTGLHRVPSVQSVGYRSQS